MSTDTATLLQHRKRQGKDTAVVFIHGFAGDPAKTWGRFPNLLGEVSALEQWDIFSLGYSTNLAPDIRGVWTADPAIATLATYLLTRAGVAPLKDYKALALIAHSMGGLVVQRALIDDRAFSARISHLLLFGTPSAGLKKAGFFKFFKSQVGDMAADGAFISDLRGRWTGRFGSGHAFKFWTAAGDRDVFVPPESSLLPFAEKERLVVLGDHLEIVKPTDGSSMSVQVTVDGILGGAAPGGPWNAARVAVESQEFQRAIDLLLPHAGELDDRHLVELALALESVGRRDEALDVLQSHASKDTDVRGVLAGRLKRRWEAEGRKADAESALAEYHAAYETSVKAGKEGQALYHGINVAFMELAYANDANAARKMASDVMRHCGNSPRDYWCVATEAEARLYLGQVQEALEAYREAVASRPTPAPRQLQSTYTQASWVVGIVGDEDAQSELDKVFGQVSR